LNALCRWAIVGCAMLLPIGVAATATHCGDAIKVPRGDENTLRANAAVATRTIDPSFFGFNLEWLEFQTALWDSTRRRVLPGVISIFRGFPGAIYRFPGGTNSNHLSWRDSVGPVSARPERKQVPWSRPLRAEFGLDEYLQFVKDVRGQAWYVANLYGALGESFPLTDLAASAGQLANHTAKRAHEGLPPILRWELGNELDRGTIKWSPVRFADAALQVSAAIASADPASRFVHLQQEYPAQSDRGYSASRYNKEFRLALARLKPEFAMHFYYDGPPDMPPVEFFLKQLCDVVDSAKAEGSPGNVWITEHGRVPGDFWPKTPKVLWPETANLTAAISMADMMIALTQVPEARGAFAHALVPSSSPWPMVHPRSSGAVDPSVTLLGLKVLRQNMLPEVLPAIQRSAGSGTLGANYQVRSAVLTDSARQHYSVWSINRSHASQLLGFTLQNAPGLVRYEGSESISDEQSNASNYLTGTRVVIEKNQVTVLPKAAGVWAISLPPNSVSALHFSVEN